MNVLICILLVLLGESHSTNQLLLRTTNQLFLLDTSLGELKLLVDLPNSPYSIAQDAFDDTTQTLIIGKMNPPTLLLYHLQHNSLSQIYLRSSFNQLLSFTVYKGILYALGTRFSTDSSRISLLSRNLTTILNSSTSADYRGLDVSFVLGNPMVYVPSMGRLVLEASNMAKDKRFMVALNATNSPDHQTLPWLTGFTGMWSFEGCESDVYTFRSGSLYSIRLNTAVISNLLHIQCDTSHLAIDNTANWIYTLDRCSQAGIVRWTKWNYLGESVAEGEFVWTPALPITSFTLVQNRTLSSRTCPTNLPESSSIWGTFNVYLNFIMGSILLLIILGVILTKACFHRQEYTKINDGQIVANPNFTNTLHETLKASGGKIDAEEIEIKDLIGQGSFANVYKGFVHQTEVAVKVIKCVSIKNMEQSLLEEASLMVQLRHPHVVLFMGASIKYPDLFLVTEYMENGSVREALDRRDFKIELEHIRRMSIDACKGMSYLHSKKIIHRDLKTHNLLVDRFWNVKVADFGLSRAIGDTEGTMTACGTPSWAAPEVLRKDHYSYKADVYSFAICLWEMITRKRPYAKLKPYQVVISVATDGLRPEIDPSVVPPNFEKVIKMAWADTPEVRPDFPKIREILEEMKCPVPQYPCPTIVTSLMPMSMDIITFTQSSQAFELHTAKKL